MGMRSILMGAVAFMALWGGHAHAQPVQGFGNGVPLSFAVRQIVPPDMLVNFDERVNQGARVSWRGGEDWRVVLERVVASQGAGVSYMGQLIRIHPGSDSRQANSSTPAPAPAQAASQGINTGGLVVLPSRGNQTAAEPVRVIDTPSPVPARQINSAPAQPPAAEPAPHPARAARQQANTTPTLRNNAPSPRQVVTNGTWRVARGETLDQVLGDWAERAGWTLVFQSPIVYEMQAGAEFTGEFTEAVAALVRSIRARPVPIAHFYRGNNVLVVSNNVNAN